MTTIAIDHNTISADSRSTSNGVIRSDYEIKINKRDGVIYAGSGSTSDIDMLVSIIFDNVEIPNISLNSNIVTIDKNEVKMHSLTDEGYDCWTIPLPYAFGSGGQFALAAMDLGKTSKEAVKYAMTRDIYSGGKIKTMTWRK